MRGILNLMENPIDLILLLVIIVMLVDYRLVKIQKQGVDVWDPC